MPSAKQQRAALERVIDLALFLAAHPDRPIPGAVIKAEVYNTVLEAPQTTPAFLRMLNRDRSQLEAAGLSITADPEGNYTFGSQQNYATDPGLNPAERAAAALAAIALADDPLFPMPVALRLALIKLSRLLDENGALLDSEVAVRSNLALAAPSSAARWTELILHAQLERHCLELHYRNKQDVRTIREIAPYGLFLLGGQWFLAGHDSLHDDIRVFAVARIEEAQMLNHSFQLPDDFSVERWQQLPFRLSSAPRDREAHLLIPATRAHEAEEITRGKGMVEPGEEGVLLWTIPYSSGQQDHLIRYALEHGLNFTEDSSIERAALHHALEKVARLHA